MPFNFSINKPIIKEALSILALVTTFFVSVATSYDHVSLTSGKVYIISDCISGNLEAYVNVSNYQIVDSSGLSFLDFGFPLSIVNPDGENTGLVNGNMRSCKKSFGGNTTDKDLIFACHDNGEYTCSILIQKP